MDTKIFLQGFDSKVSSNTSEGLNVQFKGRRKLLPLNDVAEVISQYDQYKEEREKCNIIRLTCQVNPICSNVLFNKITEVVKHEGYSGVSFINYGVYGTDERGNSYEYNEDKLFSGVTYKPNTSGAMEFWSGGTMNYQGNDDNIHDFDSWNTIFSAIEQFRGHSTAKTIEQSSEFNHPTNSIRDTQLSNTTSSFVYHCGLDIFNNHLIRSNTFKTVCKMPEMYDPASAYTDDYQGFNTIADIMRDVRGDKVVEKICFPVDVGVDNHARLVALHLYEYDDLYSFTNSVKNRLIKKFNGWLGFENRSKIKSYLNFSGDTELEIERPLMYVNGGDFVDMYPGRDLYSFVPKYNIFRKRIEKNWNYCITYPSSSYTPSNSEDPFSDIIESNDQLNSMKTVYFDENTRSDNGTTQLVMYSVAKHGLSKGDFVNIYKTYKTRQYWVIGQNDERISEKYNSETEADDEFIRLQVEGKISMDCNESKQVTPKGVTASSEAVTINAKVLDNAEVSEIVDDYIFTVFNSSTQLSKNWIKVSKEIIKGVKDLVVTMSGITETGEIAVKTRTFKIDGQTKKFFREVKSPTEFYPTLYYLVNDEYVNIDETTQDISYKKVVSDIECEYYIRIFSKLPNFKFASGDTSSEYELYKNNEKIIHDYQDKKYDFENHISRLAFAKNIYTDEVGEIVFTDDIDISNIHDNLGRPLTSLYLTFIKNNKGYKEWYGYDYHDGNWNETEISGETVEFSHAFGRVTCGIQTSYEPNYGNDVNCINRITNLSDSGNITPSGYMIDGILNDVEEDEFRNYRTESNKVVDIVKNEIWYDTDKHFYGDLCYYDSYNAMEKHISYVMHRFNTAQRESVLSESSKDKEEDDAENSRIPYFKHYVYDEIEFDDYDSSEEYEISAIASAYECDNKEEGYYYNPHYEIPIKTFDKLQTIMPDLLTIRQLKRIEDNVYQITSLQQHFLSVGDKSVIYDITQDKYYNLVTISGDSDNYRVFTCMVYDEKTNNPTPITCVDGLDEEWFIENLSSSAKTVSDDTSAKTLDSLSLLDYRLFKMDNLGCPSYAKVLKDGTCRVIWRDVLNNGFNKSDDSVEEYPYTNGAFYVNRKVDIYVRRQDPHNEYWLYSEDDVDGVSVDIAQEDNYVKDADIEC